MNLQGMHPEVLDNLGVRTLEHLTVFVQSHLISHGSRWMRRKAYIAWRGVQESLAMILYDIIKVSLRSQNGQDALHQTEMLQAIADSIGDTSQTADVTIHGFSILPQLKGGAHSSPLNGAISKALRPRWDLNSLSPQIWIQGYRQRKAMYTASARFHPEETLQLILLAQRHFRQVSTQRAHHPEASKTKSVSFHRRQ